MSFGDKHYVANVKDARTGDDVTTGCFTFVYDAGTKTLATLYANDARTSLANPITRTRFATDGKLDFYAAGVTVDIFINDALGNEAFIPGFSPTDHSILLDKTGVDKHLIAAHATETTETDTALDFPYGVEIYRVMVEVVTIDATETIDVGLLSSETAGDANGLLALAALGTAGFIQPWDISDTTTEDFTSPAYYGALMGTGTAGTSAANDTGNPGGSGHIVTGANAVSLTYTCSAGSDTAAGYIHAWFRHLR